MYVLNLYGDLDHTRLIRADRYRTVDRIAYYLGKESSDVYNWMYRRVKSKGIFKFVEINVE